MTNLADAIHMTVNHTVYFPHWTRARYGRAWMGWNPYAAIVGCYLAPKG